MQVTTNSIVHFSTDLAVAAGVSSPAFPQQFGDSTAGASSDILRSAVTDEYMPGSPAPLQMGHIMDVVSIFWIYHQYEMIRS